MTGEANRPGMTVDPDDLPKRGRRPKFDEATLRQRMIDAAVELLLEHGVSARLEAVRLDRVVVDAEVPRGSAYTAWSHPERSPQENLQHAVMLEVLQATTGNQASPTRDYTLTLMTELAPLINSPDIADRREARTELIRLVSKFNNERLNSEMWKVYRAMAMTVTTQNDPDPELVAAIEQGEEHLVLTYAHLFAELASLLGLKLKPGITTRKVAIAMIALNDGLVSHPTPAFDQSEAMTIDGKEWTLYSYCCDALIDAFCEF